MPMQDIITRITSLKPLKLYTEVMQNSNAKINVKKKKYNLINSFIVSQAESLPWEIISQIANIIPAMIANTFVTVVLTF